MTSADTVRSLLLCAAMVLLTHGESTRVIRTRDGAVRVDVVTQIMTPTRRARWLRARGIQYAEHPTGHLRWQPPVALKPWEGVKEALDFGPDCYQAPWYSRLAGIGSNKMSEGCLYLNIYAPNGTTAVASASAASPSSTPTNSGTAPETPPEVLPVLVWIHGGSFTFGGSSAYDGDAFFAHRRDVVLVTVNYRLGALGWLGGKAVATSTTDGSSGNFGLQDTRSALGWIRRNIGAFGGDPDRVTISGESAGASIVETHLATPKSNGLFSGAIMQSGAFDNYTVQAHPEEGFRALQCLTVCEKLPKPYNDTQVMTCLRSLALDDVGAVSVAGSAGGGGTSVGGGHARGGGGDGGLPQALANTSSSGWFSPNVDNVELTAPPEVYAATGKLNKVEAVMVGSNLNEGRYLMPFTMPVPNAPDSNADDLKVWLLANYANASTSGSGDGGVVTKILEEYAGELSSLGGWKTASLIYTESQYLCPTQRSAQWLTAPTSASKLTMAPVVTAASRGTRYGPQAIVTPPQLPPSNVYAYELVYEPSVMKVLSEILYDKWCNWFIPCKNITEQSMGVGHTSDIYLLWNNKHLNATDKIVSRVVNDYWQNFASSYNPSTSTRRQDGLRTHRSNAVDDSVPAWPSYAVANQTQLLSVDSMPKAGLSAGRCLFWESLHTVPYSND